jgi:hypothetical protein
MNTVSHPLDRTLERLLLIQRPRAETAPLARAPFKTALAISALRCIVQYVALPFALPLVGIAANPPVWLGLTCNAIALVALFSSLRRIWMARHPKRFAYLPLALLTLFAITIFTLTDLQTLTRAP